MMAEVQRVEGYEPTHDIKRFDFKTDLAFGHEGEEIVRLCLEKFANGDVEVKYDRFRNGRIFVEYEQNPRGEGWKPSGIAVTTAVWWAYVFSPGGWVMIEVTRLKRYLKQNWQNLRHQVAAPESENPTRGALLYPEQVTELITLSTYD